MRSWLTLIQQSDTSNGLDPKVIFLQAYSNAVLSSNCVAVDMTSSFV